MFAVFLLPLKYLFHVAQHLLPIACLYALRVRVVSCLLLILCFVYYPQTQVNMETYLNSILRNEHFFSVGSIQNIYGMHFPFIPKVFYC